MATQPIIGTLVVPDVHIPFEDKVAVNCLLEFASAYQPDQIVLVGDLVDFYQVSKYVKTDKRSFTVQEEADIAHNFLSTLRKVSKCHNMTLITGNHSQRLAKYLASQAPQLADIRGLTIESLLGLDVLKCRLIPYNEYYKVGNVYIIHGIHCGVNATRTGITKYGESTIQGHSHKISSTYHTFRDKQISVHEIGTLADFHVSKDYTDHCNWQHGFATIESIGSKEFITVHHIQDGICLYRDKVIDGNKSKIWR